jgi:hypothetical protein
MFLFVLLVITCSLEFYVGYAQNQQFVAIQEAPIRIHAVPNGVFADPLAAHFVVGAARVSD